MSETDNSKAGDGRRDEKGERVPHIPLWTGVREIYARMSLRRRRQLYVVLLLTILGAAAELATIGAIIPFLALLANDSSLAQLPGSLERIGRLLDAIGQDRLIIAMLLFVTAAVLAAIVRLRLAWSSQNFIFQLGHDLGVEVQRRILWQPYSFHIHRNTSTLLSSLAKTEILVFSVLLPLMHSVTAAFILCVIVGGLVYVDPSTALPAAAAIAFAYLLVSAATRRRLAINSATLSRTYDDRLQTVQESLGGIRDVIVDNSHDFYLEAFRRIDRHLTDARTATVFISTAPRFVMEAAGMVLIAAVAFLISSREGGMAVALPILGALALGAQRLLPLVQQIFNGWSSAAGNRSTLAEVLGFLRLPMPSELEESRDIRPLAFTKRISLEGVGFSYPTRELAALEDISFEIPRGAMVGLIGETGSGKSTLADLLMGLIDPTRGQILVDGKPLTRANRRKWQRNIAHVPQAIFLADASIGRNIALSSGDGVVDLDRVVQASRKAHLHDFVTSLPSAYDTIVGERGIRLSGGERQRLGIARAIYKQTPVLVLDEATSALDDATESAIIEALVELRAQGRTIIAIAHRQSTIARCDIVVRLHQGSLVGLGSYSEIVGETG